MDYIQSYTKHIVVRGIRIMAVFMLIGGIVLYIHSNHKAWDVGLFLNRRDVQELAMWHQIEMLSVISILNSVFVYGASYIVEAACLYIEKRHEEIDSSAEDSE